MSPSLLDLLAPTGCWSCRGPAPGGHPLCGSCAAALPWLEDGPDGERGQALDRWWAPLAFAGPARDLVHALKFSGAAGIAGHMGAQMALRRPAGLFAPGTVLVPIPAHPLRRRRRGFDHAEALTVALAARLGLPVQRALRREARLGARQRGLDRRARLEGSALVLHAAGVAPARCVLIDDVRTTGATLEACARVLRAAGAGRVSAATYARVP
ncbi:unannotated protein [freshwater metagenome]|uniref:Unannotated protein n=1 Tax=freshwater metagenome TaxID=449393 RepID=A0A6J7JHQ9_9ZZZZ|nr:ComF family protein [Actinomycetota bacterium]